MYFLYLIYSPPNAARPFMCVPRGGRGRRAPQNRIAADGFSIPARAGGAWAKALWLLSCL